MTWITRERHALPAESAERPLTCIYGTPTVYWGLQIMIHSEASINITGVGVVPGTLSPHPCFCSNLRQGLSPLPW